MAAAFPHAEIEEITDATTFVSIDRPDAVARAIGQLLESDPHPTV